MSIKLPPDVPFDVSFTVVFSADTPFLAIIRLRAYLITKFQKAASASRPLNFRSLAISYSVVTTFKVLEDFLVKTKIFSILVIGKLLWRPFPLLLRFAIKTPHRASSFHRSIAMAYLPSFIHLSILRTSCTRSSRRRPGRHVANRPNEKMLKLSVAQCMKFLRWASSIGMIFA